MPHLIAVGQTVRAYEIPGKHGLLSRSLKVIGTDTDRPGSHDFPLKFHSMDQSHTVFKIQRWLQTAIFLNLCLFNVHAEGFLWIV